MKRLNPVFLILIILNRQSSGFLNENEQKISVALMEALSIDHLILLQEPYLGLQNLQIFKNPIFRSKPASYQSTDGILKYFRKNRHFPDPKTLIVFKIQKQMTAINFLKTITKMRKSQLVVEFFWLLFMDSYKLTEKDKNKLSIPVNSEFIMSYPVNSKIYKLVEIYKIKTQTVTFDFGIWNGEKLEVTDIPWYTRRRNLQNETLVMAGLSEYGRVGECRYPRHCAYLQYMETLAGTMNFSFEWIKFLANADLISNRDKIDIGDFPHNYFHHNSLFKTFVDVTGPVFKNDFNWYIREPKDGKRPDFYIQPFETRIWISILLAVFLGGLSALIQTYLLREMAEEKWQEFHVRDQIFMPLDCFCNQEGSKPGTRNSSRILCFFIRFSVLFLFGAYSATITSFSAVRIPKAPFRNVDEFIKNGKYSVLVYWLNLGLYLDNTTDPRARAIAEKTYLFNNMTETTEKLCTGDFAYLTAENDVFLENFPCKIYQIEKPFLATWAATGVQKNSPYKKIIDEFLITFYSSGLRQRTYKTFLTNFIEKENTALFDYVEFEQIVQILEIFATGVLISVLIVFSSEIICFRVSLNIKKRLRNTRRRKKIWRK